jgi:DinB superfamily
MNPTTLIDAMERFAAIIPAVVRNLPDEQARWKPDDKTWSILEIVTHLADEEVEDFRARLDTTLNSRGWPPIDPVNWAIDRKYNQGRLDDAVNRFVAERNKSVTWLKKILPQTDWATSTNNPNYPPIRAGDLLTAWAAHDALHLRQLANRMHDLACRAGGDYSAGYAGA